MKTKVHIYCTQGPWDKWTNLMDKLTNMNPVPGHNHSVFHMMKGSDHMFHVAASAAKIPFRSSYE